MSPARRDRRRRDWPRGLYETRPGYYVWRHPKTGKTYTLGKVELAYARNEALMANQKVADESRPSLVAMLSGETHTVAELIAMVPPPPKATSQRTFKSLYKAISDHIGGKLCGELTVKDCADLLEAIKPRGEHMAKGVRSRLVAVCRRGCELGWMKANVAEVTGTVTPTVMRGRLSLEQFLAIREQASGYLPRAMNLALVTGQDRSTIASMKRSHVKEGRLICQRSKTNDKNPPIAIPVALRLNVLGLSLDDILRERSRVVSHYLIHRDGAPVPLDTITADFTAARRAAGIPDVGPDGKEAPTFHEIRSLAKRLYRKQGGVDTKQLLGHASDSAADLYDDPRDMEPVEVNVIGK